MTVPFRGRQACECLAKWLPAYERALKDAGIKAGLGQIYQLIGTNPKSGGTHIPGGAYDISTRERKAILIAREMGAAAWERPYNWDGHNSGAHHHGVLRGCPHNSGGRYQIDALDAGFNGLGRGGRGARDTGPRNYTVRTWEQGILWAKSQRPAKLDLVVVTTNLCENPRHDDTVLADLHELGTYSPDLVLFQESGNEVYKRKIASLKHLEAVFLDTAGDMDAPIGYDPTELKPGKVKALLRVQEGWAKVTPNRSLASHRFLGVKSKVRIVAHSVHPISGGFASDGSTNREGAGRARRRTEWRRSQRMILSVLKWNASLGLPQVLGADTNRKVFGLSINTKAVGRRVQQVHNGFDFIYFIDGRSYEWVLIGEKIVVDTNSDHHAVIQRAKLVSK